MKEPLSYNDWFCVTRPRVHSPYLDLDTEVELAEPLTELFVYITAERLTDERVERFCSGFLRFLDALYTTAEAFADETLAKAPHYWRLGPANNVLLRTVLPTKQPKLFLARYFRARGV